MKSYKYAPDNNAAKSKRTYSQTSQISEIIILDVYSPNDEIEIVAFGTKGLYNPIFYAKFEEHGEGQHRYTYTLFYPQIPTVEMHNLLERVSELCGDDMLIIVNLD